MAISMVEALVNLFSGLPPQVATAFLAMIPVTELRAAVPVAMGVFGLSAIEAVFWAVLGDVVPAIFIVTFIGPVTGWFTRRFAWAEKVVNWWFEKVIKDFEPKFKKYGPLALLLFVAIPLPITGAWTGAVASFLFKIPKKQAIAYIGAGLVASGVIVALITSGAFALAAGR